MLSMTGSALRGLFVSTIGLSLLSSLLRAQTIKPFEEQFPALKRVDHFERYTPEHGLSTTLCYTAPLIDNRGFLWVGTAEGLNRFDGYRFVVYRNDPRESNSISGNHIRYLYEDRNGTLWTAVFALGINEYDRKTNKFYRFRHKPNDSTPQTNMLSNLSPRLQLFLSASRISLEGAFFDGCFSVSLVPCLCSERRLVPALRTVRTANQQADKRFEEEFPYRFTT